MRKCQLLLPLMLLALSACATTLAPNEPGIIAGNILLAAQGTIVNIRRQVGVPCQKGIIPQDVCQQIGSIYEQSKPAYDTAVDAVTLYLSNPTAANQADAQAKQQAIINLASEVTTLAVKYGIKGGQ
jgi:hypothetical protein